MTNSLRPRRLAALALVLALAAPLTLAASPAGAVTEPITFTVAGTIAVGPPPVLTLPSGSTITFDHDPVTGAITNAVATIPTFNRGAVEGPQAFITLTNAAPGTGTWDRASGAGTLELSLAGSIEVPFLEATCALLEPIALSLSTANPGGQPVVAPSPGTPAVGVVTASGFTVPATSEPVVTDAAVPAISGCAAVDAFLDLPTAETSASFTVAEQLPAPPAPEPTPEPARPAFTG